MPSGLKYFSKKPPFIPSELWNGSGYYYNRGEGRWTKYSQKKDKARGHGIGTGKYRQTHD